jgi:hypothetical protein
MLERLRTIPLSHGEVHFRWNRPGTLILPGTTRMWGVTLNLVTTSNRRRGALAVHRLYHEQPLHLDVNLLISEFPVALADALDRVIARSVEVAPKAAALEALADTQVEAAG